MDMVCTPPPVGLSARFNVSIGTSGVRSEVDYNHVPTLIMGSLADPSL